DFVLGIDSELSQRVGVSALKVCQTRLKTMPPNVSDTRNMKARVRMNLEMLQLGKILGRELRG
ncbi:hypothetical protein FCV25MIE_24827, partial [Fagus crenata]